MKNKTYFTSDTHFYHHNIIKYSDRPFDDVFHMNNVIISNWNSVVSPNDTVYHLGDVFCGLRDLQKAKDLLFRLNGKIHLILGNHDDRKFLMQTGRFESIHNKLEIKIPDPDANRGVQDITLDHYLMAIWNKHHHGAWHLHGHSHGSMYNSELGLEIYKRKAMDVGVDPLNFFPISYEEIKRIMNSKIVLKVDHH